MAKIQGSPFKLSQVTVEKFSIERNPNDQGKFKVDIEPSGYLSRAQQTFMLVLQIHVYDTTNSFDINMSVFGHFDYKDVEDEERLNNYFYTNAPALVFPYVRSYISAVSALSGLSAIQLPVMNLTSLKNKLKESIVELPASEKLLN